MSDQETLKIFTDIWPNADFGLIPDHMQPGLMRYIVHGIPPGSFLSAVCASNLFEAARRADDKNIHCLVDYVRFLINWAPMGCFGSKEAVNEWVKSGGMVGLDKS